jgi:FkbM family methyltransferase
MVAAYYREKLRQKGIREIVAGRLRWYKQCFQMDNWLVGKYVELTGNMIEIDGIRIAVDNNLVTTRHKSSLYFGIYEIAERELSKQYIDRSLPTVEVGGSIGGVACIVNRLLVNPIAHVVMECNPVILPTLTKNRILNNCQFTIEASALAYGADKISFGISNHFMKSSVSDRASHQITVPATTLRQVLDKYRFLVVNLISDSEGSEVEMVENDSEVLRDRVKWIILETHAEERGREAIERTLEKLASLGFDTVHHDANKPVLALRNRRL